MIIQIKSALVSGVLMMVLAMAMYVIGVGDIFSIDGRVLANTGVMALLTAIVSFIKSVMTTGKGTVLGVKVK